MSLVSRQMCRRGFMIATVLAIAGSVPALASRPATSAALVRARPHAEIGAGHSVSGGGRGGRIAAHREAPRLPPVTRAASSSRDGCLVLQTNDGGRRSPQARTTSRVVAFGCLRVVRVADRPHDGRGPGAAALYHDAHAPPSSVTDVAGLLA